MNQKNYKKIAEIIKKHIKYSSDYGEEFVNELADYFDKKALKDFERLGHVAIRHCGKEGYKALFNPEPVSYTHLTLPTILLV